MNLPPFSGGEFLSEVSGSTLVLEDYVGAPRAHYGPGQNVSGRILVSIHEEPAMRAVVDSDGKLLRYETPAALALLRRVLRIDFDTQRPGLSAL